MVEFGWVVGWLMLDGNKVHRSTQLSTVRSDSLVLLASYFSDLARAGQLSSRPSAALYISFPSKNPRKKDSITSMPRPPKSFHRLSIIPLSPHKYDLSVSSSQALAPC